MNDYAVGAIRASVGIASNDADVARLMAVLATFRDAPAASVSNAQTASVVTAD